VKREDKGRREGRRCVEGNVLICVGTNSKERKEEKREGRRENCAWQESKKYRK